MEIEMALISSLLRLRMPLTASKTLRFLSPQLLSSLAARTRSSRAMWRLILQQSSPSITMSTCKMGYLRLIFVLSLIFSFDTLHVQARRLQSETPKPTQEENGRAAETGKVMMEEQSTKAEMELGEMKNLPPIPEIPLTPQTPGNLPFTPPLPIPQVPFTPQIPGNIPFLPPSFPLPQNPFTPPLGIPNFPPLPPFPFPSIPNFPPFPPFNIPNNPFFSPPPA